MPLIFHTQDIKKNEWLTPHIPPPLPSGRRSHSALCLDNNLLIFGGYNGSKNGKNRFLENNCGKVEGLLLGSANSLNPP